MDLKQTIEQLYAEKQRLEQVIASLEALQSGSVSNLCHLGGKWRGRKSMAAAEREEVSRRMKRYWAKQRELRQAEG